MLRLGFTSVSINRAPILSSLSDRSNPDTKPQPCRKNVIIPLQPPSVPAGKQQTGKKPSVAEVERAIGAGIYKDRDLNRESEQEKTLFDQILSNSIGTTEGDVEKKLRETGEWLIDQTEGPSGSGSPGKNILKVVFLWILPVWILSFLVASGIVKIPFVNLDDLIMLTKGMISEENTCASFCRLVVHTT